MKKYFDMQLFAEENATMAADLEPAVSIDHVSRLTGNIQELQKVLGVAELTPMASGTTVKVYKMEVVSAPANAAEGETIALTKIERKLAKTIELELQKKRRNTTAESIQKTGKSVAINQTDAKLVSIVQKEIKRDFYDVLAEGTGEASGIGLQAALASAWAAIQKVFADEDVTPIYFVSSDDLADYLGAASVTMQQAFGLSYIQDFLGLGTVVVSPTLAKGTVIATAKENLNGVYIPANSGDVATTFGLTSDTTGLVGMCHSVKTDNATIDTLVMYGVVFYPELLDGVIKATISPATGA